MKPINRIHQLAFDVNFTATPADEKALPIWIQENLLPVIDQVMQQLSEQLDEKLHNKIGQSGNIIRIKRLEKLEIDLGTVNQAESASELQRRLHSQLMNALAFEFAEKTEHSVREHEANIHTTQLLNFLSTGQLHWSLEQQGKQAHRHLLNNVLAHFPNQIPNEIPNQVREQIQNQSPIRNQASGSHVVETCLSQILNDEVQLTRLVRQFDTPELFQILKVNLRNWSVHEQEFILDWISLELLRLSSTSSTPSSSWSSNSRRELQQNLWKHLLKASEPSNPSATASESSLSALIMSWLRPRQQTLSQAFKAYAQMIEKDRSLSNTTRAALQLVLKNLSQGLIGDDTKLAHEDVTSSEKNKEANKKNNSQVGSWSETKIHALRDLIMNSRTTKQTDTETFAQSQKSNDSASHNASKNKSGEENKPATKAAVTTSVATMPAELNEVLRAWPSLLQKPNALRALFERHQQAYLHTLPLRHLLDVLHIIHPSISAYWQPDLGLISGIENQTKYEHKLRQFLQKLLSKNSDTFSAQVLKQHISEQLAQDPAAEFLLPWIKTAETAEAISDITIRSTTNRLEQDLRNSDPKTLNAAIEEGLKTDLQLLHLLRPQLWRHWLAYASEMPLSQLAQQFQKQIGQAALEDFFSGTTLAADAKQHSRQLAALALMLAARPGSLDAMQLQAMSSYAHSSSAGTSERASAAIPITKTTAIHQATATDKSNDGSNDKSNNINTAQKIDDDDRKNARVLFERLFTSTSMDSKPILSQLMLAHSKELVPLWRTSQVSQRTQLVEKFSLDNKIDLLALLYPVLAPVLHPTINLLEASATSSLHHTDLAPRNAGSDVVPNAKSMIQASLKQFTVILDDLLLSDSPQVNSIKQRLRELYDKFLTPTFASLAKTGIVNTTQAPSRLPGQNLSRSELSQLHTIWLTLLDYPQEAASATSATTLSIAHTISIKQAQTSDALALNGLNPLLYAFRQWQLSHLQLAQLALTVEELEQFLHWWILQQSDNETSNPPDNYALMLASIKHATQESTHPALLMELLLESLRDDQALDLEAIKLQVRHMAAHSRSVTRAAVHNTQTAATTTQTQAHFLLRLEEFTNSELAEENNALQPKAQKESSATSEIDNQSSEAVVANLLTSKPGENTHPVFKPSFKQSFKQSLARIFADANKGNEAQANTRTGEQYNNNEHEDLEQFSVLAKTEPSRSQQNMLQILSNPVFQRWTIEWLNAQLNPLTNLSVTNQPTVTQTEPDFASNFASDLTSDFTPDLDSKQVIEQVTTQTQEVRDPVTVTSPENFALLLLAMNKELPAALYRRWQLTASAAFAVDKNLFENLSQHPQPTSSASYQLCFQAYSELLTASHGTTKNQNLSTPATKQTINPKLLSATDIKLVNEPSALPAQLRQTLPHKLAQAMINGRLDSLEWIWDDIKRHHAKLLQQAQRRYLKNSSLREKIIAHHAIGQLVDLLENLSLTAATSLKELWQAWDICRQYLNPTMDLTNCQTLSSRAAFSYLLDHDSPRPQLNEFMESICLALLDKVSRSDTSGAYADATPLPDLLAACLEELDRQPASYVPHLKAAMRDIRQVSLLVAPFNKLLAWQEPTVTNNSVKSGNTITTVLDKTQVQKLFVQTICTQAPSLLESILRHQDHRLSTNSAEMTIDEENETHGADEVKIGAANAEHLINSNNTKHLNSLSENQLQAMLYTRLQHGTEQEQQNFWTQFAETLQVQQNSKQDSELDSKQDSEQQSKQVVEQQQAADIIQSLMQLFTAPMDGNNHDEGEQNEHHDENKAHRDLLTGDRNGLSTNAMAATSEAYEQPLNAIQESWLSHLIRLLGSHQELSLPEQEYVRLSLSHLHRQHQSAWADFIAELNHQQSLDRFLQLATLHDLARLFRLLRPALANDIPDIIASIETVFKVSLSSNAKLLTRASWHAIYRAEISAISIISGGKTHRYQDFLCQLLSELARTHSLPEPSEAIKKLAAYQPALDTPSPSIETDTHLDKNRNTNQSTNQNANKNTNQHSDSRNKNIRDQLPSSLQDYFNRESSSNSTAHESYVLNAGMVIIAPYVQRLFGLLELVQNGSFVDEIAAQRAVHLLQYIVTGETQTPEFQLTLNKLLCGIHGGVPIVTGIDISTHEEEVIQQMLQGVIGHWHVLGNTSIQGLRETFFQRQGNLYFEEDSWRLKIEQGGFDMLLDQLPWSFAMIKFPWMSEPLHVTWRS